MAAPSAPHSSRWPERPHREIWDDLGPDSGWLGGPGESWERGPYYLDGFVPLAHLLDDDALRAKAQKWIEWMLGSQRSDGQFGPASNDDWWPRMVAAKVLQQHAEATGDDRVLPFLERFFEFQLRELPVRPLHDWAAARAAENVLALAWVHERAPRNEWIELARMLFDQGPDWDYAFSDGLITGRAMTFDHRTHGPNVAMALKNPAVRALMLGGDAHEATQRSLAHLDRWHGQVHGLFSGDEWLAGREANRGVETCQVVEYMFTMETAARVTGRATYSDLLEGRRTTSFLPRPMRGWSRTSTTSRRTKLRRPWPTATGPTAPTGRTSSGSSRTSDAARRTTTRDGPSSWPPYGCVEATISRSPHTGRAASRWMSVGDR